MSTLVETDIDQFIRGHKTKLQEEKVQLNKYTSRYPGDQGLTSPSGRKQWDKSNSQGTRPAEDRKAPIEPEETGLLPENNEIKKKRQQLQSERQQEYNDYIAKRQQMLQDEYRREEAEEHRLAKEREGLPIGVSDKPKLNEERNREYNEYLAKNNPQRSFRKKEPTPEHLRQGLPLDQAKYNEKKHQLELERQREYNELIQKKGQPGENRHVDVLEGKGATLPIGEVDNSRRQQLIFERHRDYNEQQQQKLASQRQRGIPPKPPTPNHFFKNIGQHDRQQKVLNEERKKEYNKKLAEERERTVRRGNFGAEQSVGLRIGDTDSAKGKTKEFATLPGLHYSDSAEKRKIQERNKEYNEFMNKKGKGKIGWTTPTYEEILEQKRREDTLQRQEDDYEPSDAAMRRYASEGAINRIEDEFRDRVLDKEFETRKVRFDDEFRIQNQGGILNDDNWLNPDVRREQEYTQLTEQIKEVPDMAARVRQQPFLASLPVGQDERESAKKRRQSELRRELQLQMEESKAARKREKVQELRVNASGLLDPEKSSNRMKGLEGQPGVSPRREYRSKEVQPYHTKFVLDDSGDDLRLDLGGGGRERGRRHDPALLDPGYAGLLESRRPVGTAMPPPGLMYTPSTYVTGGGGLGGQMSSIDEAYNFFATRNPLDLDVGGGIAAGIPNYNTGGDYGGVGGYQRPSPTPRVTFADEGPPTTRRRDRSKERISPYQFADDTEVRSKSRSEAQSYGAQLEQQIQAKRLQKQREKEEKEAYDRKMEAEVANYNPFGRGGGGAPMTDGSGKPIADLRALVRGGRTAYQSPRGNYSSPSYSPRPPSPRDDKIRTPPPQSTAFGEATHARGGHGIFGQPKTEAEKDQSDKYKDDLREQIAEKRRREQMEKERERMEEEKENRRLEEQRIRMQSEYEEEQRKIKTREEETRRKNEELKKQAEERKKDAERKRREAEDAKMRDQQEQLERERQEKEQTNGERGKSPPLPAQRRGRDSAASIRSQRSHRSQRGEQSPAPGPAQNRPNSSDVLTQLASMRKQLQNERKRVENALEHSKNDVDVFDPRTVQRPAPNKLIFENAVNKNASLPPPRAQTTDMANARNIQQFNELKNKAGTDSRRQFRSMFPEAPVTNTTLETQQDAMLRHQEEQLRNLREKNPYNPSPSGLSFGPGRRGNISARSQLESNSAFIDVEGVNNFPDDFDEMLGMRNESARAKRRMKDYSPRPYSDNGFGSRASLDVDGIQRKNEERLRRLNNMSSGDDISNGDPDEILNRFMAKQTFNRPPSGMTLQDDSWLKPGSKAV